VPASPQARAGELEVGVCAVFVPLRELIARAGGGGALSAAMAAFGGRSGVDVLFALSAEDRAAGGSGLKGVSVVPLTPGGRGAAAALASALEAAPEGLPPSLASQPLFVKQQLGTDGFGIGFEDADAASGLRVSPLRNAVSRKTFLPTVLHFAEQHQQAASGRGC